MVFSREHQECPLKKAIPTNSSLRITDTSIVTLQGLLSLVENSRNTCPGRSPGNIIIRRSTSTNLRQIKSIPCLIPWEVADRFSIK